MSGGASLVRSGVLMVITDCDCFFFFFKQKTAYEMLRSLVGSEMCIRDRSMACSSNSGEMASALSLSLPLGFSPINPWARYSVCLLYTSDAADDLLCVDLGGRRIIKKKKSHIYNYIAATPTTTHALLHRLIKLSDDNHHTTL